jgi:uncharacterized membrane protein YagU involved in acid resistance
MRPNLGRLILAGFLGTVAITAVMYFVAPLLIGEPMDIAAILGRTLGTTWTVGMLLHFVNGTIIFPLIYSFILWNFLPGTPTAKGTTWGVILWFLAQTIVMPFVGGGFFSANAGGIMAVVGSLVGHLIYGAILGSVAGYQAATVELRRAA